MSQLTLNPRTKEWQAASWVTNNATKQRTVTFPDGTSYDPDHLPGNAKLKTKRDENNDHRIQQMLNDYLDNMQWSPIKFTHIGNLFDPLGQTDGPKPPSRPSRQKPSSTPTTPTKLVGGIPINLQAQLKRDFIAAQAQRGLYGRQLGTYRGRR